MSNVHKLENKLYNNLEAEEKSRMVAYIQVQHYYLLILRDLDLADYSKI